MAGKGLIGFNQVTVGLLGGERREEEEEGGEEGEQRGGGSEGK